MKYKDDYASKIFFKDKKPTKEEEIEIVKNFLLRLQIEYTDIIKSERPDLIITFPSNLKVGCEVTKYYADPSSKGSTSKKFFVKWKKFTQKLREELLKRNEDYNHVYGTIHFKESKKSESFIDNNSSIKELVDIVDSNYMDLKPSKVLHTSKLVGRSFELAKKFVDHIYLKNIYPKGQYLWWAAHLQTGEIPNSKEAVKLIILLKNKLSSNYTTKNLDKKWLIIFAEGLGLNDVCIIENLKQLRIIDKISYFLNIYIFDKFTEKICQVYPEYGKIFDWSERAIYTKYLPIVFDKTG